MKWFNNIPIGHKIFTSIVAVLIVIFAIIGFVIFQQVSGSLLETIESSYQSTAKSSADLTNQQLETLKATVAAIAARSDIQSMNWEVQQKVLAQEVQRVGCMRFSVADAHGNLTAINSTKVVNVSDRAYFKKALQNIASVADPSISRVDNQLTMSVAAPIKDADGQVRGVLVAVYNGKMLSDLLGKVQIAGGKGSLYILNKEGTLIANPQMFDQVLAQNNTIKDAETDPKKRVMADIQQKMIAGGSGFGSYVYNGVTKFISYVPVSGTDWSLAVTVPRDIIFNQINMLVWLIPLLFIAALAIILLVVFGVSRIYISRPIAQVVKAAEQLAIGNVNVTFQTANNDEIGSLVQSFGKMAANIREQAQAAERIAAGDLAVEIHEKSADDIQSISMKQMVSVLRGLIAETKELSSAAIAGRLTVRGDITKFKGAYQEILQGMNDTLNAIVEPLNEAELIMNKMAANDFTREMTGSYQGMLGEFAQQINTVRSRLLNVQDIFIQLGKGDISQLEGYLKIGKRSENDQLIPSGIAMMQAIKNLIDDVNALANAASQGNLEIRGDIAKYQGGYREIVDGFNKTLDAIAAPLKETADVLQEMANGDLSVKVEGAYEGSYAVIKDSMNQTIDALNEILGGIREAAEQVASGSKQVSDGSQALSQGATEQASALEELTSSLNEVAAQTKENAANANHANELAIKAKEDAQQGNAHMAEMLKSMDGINESSASISKIIKVIDEIAFQTNILALNAAVEAARAGQYGKGFAVVAEEVRNLAARSADAAKETTVLIEGSIKKVEDGAKIADNTARALQTIVNGTSEAAQLVGAIATASNEQATGIAQINQGIEQVSNVVQTNTATSEESAAASEELSSQAGILKEMVGRFTLSRENSVGRALLADHSTGMSGKTGRRAAPVHEAKRVNIDLTDREFGKY